MPGGFSREYARTRPPKCKRGVPSRGGPVGQFSDGITPAGGKELYTMKQITVEASYTQEQVLAGQCALVMPDFDTLKEARVYARHVLTDEFQLIGELSRPFGYARVLKDGECVSDYFRT